MAYHITKIINSSPKSVLLTNPKASRDRHLVTKNNWLLLRYPPLVERIRESDVSYETVVTKALNIYRCKTTGASGTTAAALLSLVSGKGREVIPLLSQLYP
jgi:hypothetical protein